MLALQAAQAAGLQDDDFGLHSFAPEPDTTQQQGTAAGRVTAAAAEMETVTVDMEGLTAGRWRLELRGDRGLRDAAGTLLVWVCCFVATVCTAAGQAWLCGMLLCSSPPFPAPLSVRLPLHPPPHPAH